MQNKKDVEFNKDYWDKFYAAKHRHVPSQFCVCVITELDKNAAVIELGSGNGRDSLYFADRGHITIATDLSEQAIITSKQVAKERGLNNITFLQGDLTDKNDFIKIINVAREQANDSPIVFYSRFIMHTLDDEQELKFLNLLSISMKTNESIYFEFRSKEDAKLDKIHKDHFRRYVDTEVFKQRLNDLNFQINYNITGMGMAKYKSEDPVVSRIIAIKR